MTRRGVFVARRVAGGLFLVALVALIVLFAPRACGVLYGTIDERAASSGNAAQDQQPDRKDARSGGDSTAEGLPPAPGTSGASAPDEGAPTQPISPANGEDAKNKTDAASGEPDGSSETEVGGEKPDGAKGNALDADEEARRDAGGQAAEEQNSEPAGVADAWDGAQDEGVVLSLAPAATFGTRAETTPVNLARNDADTYAADPDVTGTEAPVGRAARTASAGATPTARASDVAASVESAPASSASAPASSASAPASSAGVAATSRERRAERWRERPVAAPDAPRREADDRRETAASAVVAPGNDASRTAYDSDTYADRGARGRANSRAAATPGSSASARAAAYVGEGHRARTATSAHSRAVLRENQRRAEASACSSARMRTTAPDGTVSWSSSRSCHSSWATSPGG